MGQQGVEDLLGWGDVVHHEGVVTGGPQITGTPYHVGVLVLKYGIQHLQKLVQDGVPWLPNNFPL